ncbi:uncharacterized protein LOC103310248 [Acyrthosiphon pisum]|uniref:Uncharacterized protein n=1 Tax=Acyrthosiphon pisum TaxID=7029 RepID=A0A8R2FC92_ACYPI|nr:uncharacterized protein LOC103310248 [Acyrthosiphon pisum]|eukprot:XP_008186081.1 PREDICTED: uncharacterized protein LOC103310248 [Acyrthosiphon pisum]
MCGTTSSPLRPWMAVVAVSPSCSVSRRRVVRVPLVRSASSVTYYPPSEFRVPPFCISRNRFGVRAPVPFGHLCRPPFVHRDYRRSSLAAGGPGGHRGLDLHATNDICGRRTNGFGFHVTIRLGI